MEEADTRQTAWKPPSEAAAFTLLANVPPEDWVQVTIYDRSLARRWSNVALEEARFEARGGTFRAGIARPFTRKAFKTGQAQTGVRARKEKTGETRYYQTTSIPIATEGGRVSSVLETVMDITRKRVFEEKLTRTHKNYRGLFEHSAMAVALCSSNYELVTVNDRFTDLFGYSNSEIKGRINLFQLFASEEARQIAKKRLTDLPQNFRADLISRQGRRVVVDMAADQIPESGEVILTMGDVTEGVELQEQAHRRDSHMAAVTNESADAIISIDLENRVQSWNKGAASIFGYSEAEVLDREITFLIPHDKQKENEFVMRVLLAKGYVRNFETQRLCKDGRRIDMSLTQTVLRDPSGQPRGISIMGRDITNEIILKKRLAQTEHAATLGELSGILAHEIKNPLNAMIINVELLRQRIEELEAIVARRQQPEDLDDARTPAPGGTKRYVQTLLEEIQRLDRVIRGFSDFSRLSDESSEDFQLSGLVGEVIDFLAGEAELRNIRLHWMLPAVEHRLHGQRGQLKQVIVNLLLNAFQAMPHGGLIDIQLGFDDKHRQLVLSIEDEGSGIARENLDRIFELYFTTKAQGSGIGLAVVNRVVKEFGGSVEVESEVGQGTTFRLRLPVVVDK